MKISVDIPDSVGAILRQAARAQNRSVPDVAALAVIDYAYQHARLAARFREVAREVDRRLGLNRAD